MAAVAVNGLRKSYNGLEAVRGVSFDIAEGEVFGLLGPNGAGKTTTVEILEGYRHRDAGTVSVLGADPEQAGETWRERIGIVLQSSAMYVNLTVREHVALFAGYYAAPRDADDVIDLVGLAEKRHDRVKTLSGGQQRRLDLALGLIGDPEILFLDEPTTGFDPAARRAAWEMIRSLRELGKTILLTTHYLDEAEQLADRVAVYAQGRDRRARHPAGAHEPRRGDGDPLPARRPRGRRRDEGADEDACTSSRARRSPRASSWRGSHVRKPSLEDIYLELTGGDED